MTTSWQIVSKGASIMSGHNAAVQQRIRQIAPQAVYIHCHALCLDATKQVQEASEFFVIMQYLCICVLVISQSIYNISSQTT